MKPIEFKEQNCVMNGPEGSNIRPLPVYRDNDVCVSKWELSRDDLKELAENGGCIYLSVQMNGNQPPVLLSVESLFEEVLDEKN